MILIKINYSCLKVGRHRYACHDPSFSQSHCATRDSIPTQRRQPLTSMGHPQRITPRNRKKNQSNDNVSIPIKQGLTDSLPDQRGLYDVLIPIKWGSAKSLSYEQRSCAMNQTPTNEIRTTSRSLTNGARQNHSPTNVACV
jgi:hypothetical protein